MQSVAIFPVVHDDGSTSFRAVTKAAQSEGKTAGEALDAVAPSLAPSTSGTVVLIQPFLPDDLFTANQRARLDKLMACWRAARDSGQSISADEQAELQALVEAELKAATRRTEQIVSGAME